MGKLTLTGKGRRWLQGGHPWVYADDIASGEGSPGELLPVEDPGGNLLGWGLFSDASRIAVRMVTREAEQPKRPFWEERMAAAVKRRERAGLLDPAGACRLVAGDADGFPGLIIDRYADVLVLQCGTQAADRMRDFLLEVLTEALPFPVRAVVDRSDSSVRRLEQLEKRVEVVRGELPAELLIQEEGMVYEVDVLKGHKTGHYLDQRANRLAAAAEASGQDVLDAFSYDGLFGVRCALAGARSVLCIDQSKEAGERLMRNAERNGVADRVHFLHANAMAELRAKAQGPDRFGVLIVDPPAFAKNRREVPSAERGYVELNRRAMKLAAPGGLLVTASCSYNVRSELFLRYLASAAHDARREVFVESVRSAGPDHPVLLTLPETHYLKCAFLRVE